MWHAPALTEFRRYPVIGGIALLATGVTIAWWSKVDVSVLFETAMIRRGELWRLITNIFPHVNILHLAFNIYWLWVLGTVVERAFGHLRTVALTILFATGSGAFEFGFALGGVGLSGMVYGFFGLLWILSRRDDRFANAVEQKTVKLFVAWFFFCIALTAMHIYSAGNVAHGVGAILGVLTGVAISQPRHRATATVSIGAILLFGLWGSTLGRPRINLSGKAGYEEAKWGYDALMANRNRDAARWFGDAVIYQPKSPSLWFDLGIAYQRLGNKTSAQAAYENAHQLDPNETKYSQALTALN